MKHTMETIKEKLEKHYRLQNAGSFIELKEEIIGFEKELREIYYAPKEWTNRQKDEFCAEDFVQALIKEILGEKT